MSLCPRHHPVMLGTANDPVTCVKLLQRLEASWCRHATHAAAHACVEAAPRPKSMSVGGGKSAGRTPVRRKLEIDATWRFDELGKRVTGGAPTVLLRSCSSSHRALHLHTPGGMGPSTKRLMRASAPRIFLLPRFGKQSSPSSHLPRLCRFEARGRESKRGVAQSSSKGK